MRVVVKILGKPDRLKLLVNNKLRFAMDLPIVFKDKKTGEVSSVESIPDPRDEFILQYNEHSNQGAGNSGNTFAEKPVATGMKITAQPVSDKMFWLLLVGVVFFGIQALTQFSQFVWGLINLFSS